MQRVSHRHRRFRDPNQTARVRSIPRAYPTPRKALAFVLAALLACGGSFAIAEDTPEPDPAADPSSAEQTGGRMTGKIRWARGVEAVPIAGARILAFHVGDQKLYTSEPVGRNGHYVLRGIPRGFYDVAVEVDGDVYVASEVAHVPPGANMRIDFELSPYPGGVAPSDRESFLGDGAAGSGLANARRKPRGREFWFSPKGLVIMSGIGGAALLGIALTSKDDERAASPIVTD